MADLRRDFWIRETGTGQQVPQLHDRYMMMMMMMTTRFSGKNVIELKCVFWFFLPLCLKHFLF